MPAPPAGLHVADMTRFLELDIRGRLAHIRRTLLALEKDWGTIDQWQTKFMINWEAVKGRGGEVVFVSITCMLRYMGESVWPHFPAQSCGP
jgi:hypothetical protein